MSIYKYYVNYIDEYDLKDHCKAKGIIFAENLSDVVSIVESYYGHVITSITIDEVAFDETGIFEGYTVKRENEDGH